MNQQPKMAEEEEVIEKLEEYTKNARHHQLETLRSILQHNAKVLYLQRFLSNLHHDLDADTFRSLVPLSSFEDYADYINHMAEHGTQHDSPLLSVDPLLGFFYSSGTATMKPKLIPYFDSSLCNDATFLAIQWTFLIRKRFFPTRPSINKILWFHHVGNITTAKCGLNVMPVSQYILQCGKVTPQEIPMVYASPSEVFVGSHADQQTYCHLLCGLRNLDLIDGIAAPYSLGLVKAFTLLESKWEQLCHDLERGFPSHEISDIAMREAVTETLGGPQPELSNRIRQICEDNGNDWSGIAHTLWRNVRYIKCVSTGIMKQYYPKVKYYAGEVPVVGGDYFASECSVGLNLDIMQPPETTRYVLFPNTAYFEFLPFNMNDETNNNVADEMFDLSSVEVGKMYEIVVTTYGGFYRYRLGDVVRILGFYNSSPEVEFVMRAPKAASEILTERDLISAIDNFQLSLRGAMMRIQIVEFASFLDQESRPKQLKVFVEVQEESDFMEDKQEESIRTLRSCITSLEGSLGALYKVEKVKGQLGNLMVFILRPGAFDKLYEVAIRNGTPASQYKPPKILRNHEIVSVLEKYSLCHIR
ncbi:hypothetical protein HN51_038880 [Arachis hypogaea]|uniref:Indole-3-acetic acid-amido synthetase GH3.6 n=1 Tax=Arachis hypogaea TaxID=3818 RepID=A0A444YH19_ARAHY|nr:probable indole-3-acetic acid-amido synthetase GH3.6 [Arachis hypogaea]QHN84320.1 putative indole-3-acetic acid-amido synthetase GH3 [Arachis hypogaea]RYR01216.1 hypothetical protein Ahy_B06g080089 [Arachis hypogaea]